MHISSFTKRLFGALLLLSSFCGCSKYVSLDPPTTQIEAARLFASDAAAIAAVHGVYSVMTQSDGTATNGGPTIYGGLAADELYNPTTNADYDLFYTNSLVVNNGTGITLLWKFGYRPIYAANAILEGIAASTSLTDSLKQQLRGEMLVVRALHFFYLTQFFGDVPYTTTTDYRVNGSMPRTSKAQVYEGMIRDLTEAVSLLKGSYPTGDKARPNRWTATALLARIYLYLRQYQEAESAATAVLESGAYNLVSFPANPFAASSPETLWQLPRSISNTADALVFIPAVATARPTFALTTTLVNAFEAGDLRKSAWLGKNTVSGVDYWYPYKYKNRANTPVTEYLVVFRLAELYLIRAEARAAQNNIAGAKADLDRIRMRAGLAGTTATTPAALLQALEKERQVEFFAEWGHRWLDVIRWGKADALFRPVKTPNWQATDTLFPIPLVDMQNNPFLVQNPGYQ